MRWIVRQENDAKLETRKLGARMKLEIRIGETVRRVELARAAGRLVCTLDGRAVEADAVEITPGVYSVLLGGRAFEVRVDAEAGPDGASALRIHTGAAEFAAEVLDPRAWRGRRGSSVAAEGMQQITAPMPGKIVRVLVSAGDTVEAGQGLLVVEAMKMQNEIRAPKAGKVEKLHVAEGQAVTSGQALAVIS
jgi:biotin carboxyl carrier protein